MNIGEFSRRLGVTPPTVRYYESLGLLTEPHRVSGRRRYGAEAINGLRLVLALKGAGFTLSEIRRLVALSSERRTREAWQRIARDKLGELDATIAELSAARTALASSLDCACDGDADRCALLTQATGIAARSRRNARRRNAP